jgi:hypothetical protein
MALPTPIQSVTMDFLGSPAADVLILNRLSFGVTLAVVWRNTVCLLKMVMFVM